MCVSRRMPQTKKSRIAPAQGGAPVDPVEVQAAGGGEEDNVGDDDIVKSPSDPKQYRYTGFIMVQVGDALQPWCIVCLL